jgi:hypothetical protein
MVMTDDDLTGQLESVPLVESPDFREAVMGRIKASGQPRTAVLHFPRRRVLVGLAWAAAVVIALGFALERASSPRPQSAAATMAPLAVEEWPVVARVRAEGSTLTVRRNGDRFAVGSALPGTIDWDRAKLSMIEVLPSGTVVIQRRPDAAGSAEIRLSVAGREILKTSISVE